MKIEREICDGAYQSLDVENEKTSLLIHSGESLKLNIIEDLDQNKQATWKLRLFWAICFLLSFTFYFYCVFVAMKPFFFPENIARRLDETTDSTASSTVTPNSNAVEDSTSSTDQKCSIGDAALLGGVGAAAATVAVVGGFWLAGLSTVGPVAGGWFASNMGAGLTAGSWMATAQSAAMTSSTYGTAAALGALSGAAARCIAI